MADTPERMLAQYSRGKITYDDLKAYFAKTKFVKTEPVKGDWGKVWLRAEEGPSDFDGFDKLRTAQASRRITQPQYRELLAIVRRNIDQRAT